MTIDPIRPLDCPPGAGGATISEGREGVQSAGPSTGDLWFFAVVVGALSSTIGYAYALDAQIECLAPVLGFRDSTIYPRDLLVRSFLEYNPRFFYTTFMALASAPFGPEVGHYVVRVAVGIALAALAAFAARSFFPGRRHAPFLAATLVSAVGNANLLLGTASYFTRAELVPSGLAMPFGLMGLWNGIAGRPYRCAAWAVAGTLFHVLAGGYCGIVGIGGIGLVSLAGVAFAPDADARRRAFREGLHASAALVAMGAAVYGMWFLPFESDIPDDEFVHIYLRMRNANHLVPSIFPWSHWFGFACFLAGGGVAWTWAKRERRAELDAVANRMAGATATVVLLLLMGWVFVELIPSRTLIPAQTFRSIADVNWIGLLLLAYGADRTIQARRGWSGAASAVATCSGTGGFQPLVMAAGLGAEELRLRSGGNRAAGVAALAATLAALLVAHRADGGEMMLATTWLFLAIGWWMASVGDPRLRFGVPAAGTALALLILFGAHGFAAPFFRGPLASPSVRPTFTEVQGNQLIDPVARFARDNTPIDALFIQPYALDRFQIVARRSILVTFVGTPVSGRGLREWRRRLAFAFGEPDRPIYDAIDELNQGYRAISPEKLLALRDEFGVTHAVLFAETPTPWPASFEANGYKLVEIPEGVAPTDPAINAP